jgi:hypothetical protein
LPYNNSTHAARLSLAALLAQIERRLHDVSDALDVAA